MTEVVVILPFVKDRVLLQLRDFKPTIEFPGCWGFFGGSIDKGESPIDAAKREIFEEIGFNPRKLHSIGEHHIADLGNMISHSFYCDLNLSIDQLQLKEGADFTLAHLEEVKTASVYSPKLLSNFPVAHTYYIPLTISHALTLRGVGGTSKT